MEIKDIKSLDWDDSELRRAYAIAFNNKNTDERGKKNLPPQGKKKRNWKVGDYCRTIYAGDCLYYEAKIISLNGDFCTVEFVGYGDKADVDLLELKPSNGEVARKYQIAESKIDSFAYDDSVEEFSEISEEIDTSCNSGKKEKKRCAKKSTNNATLDRTRYEATFHQHYSGSAAQAPSTSTPANLPFMPSPVPMPQNSVLPPPPMMPQCPSIADNPTLAAMLSAWYLSGYYTGLRSASMNHGCHHCCNHSSHCNRQ
ncbi:survival motor neuron protein-like [Argiope bruennichi]|uniref:survival motor neuron protein-like n=1 Tax=Argiope bruennichi TaxID=94029 RepID=UPI0024942FB4|nr:survival motor neuron protein-like [Argiope bruennichi]